MVEAVHVGEPSLDDPKRTVAPEITKENIAPCSTTAVNAGKPLHPLRRVTPTGPNEPPRSDQPSDGARPDWPLLMAGTGVGVSVVNAPSGEAAAGS